MHLEIFMTQTTLVTRSDRIQFSVQTNKLNINFQKLLQKSKVRFLILVQNKNGSNKGISNLRLYDLKLQIPLLLG